MPQYKAKYLENLDTHVEVELSIPVYDFIRTIADNSKQPMSEVCLEILNFAQLDRRWVEEYKKGRPYDSRYASRRKKGVKETSEMTPKNREGLKKIIAICDLLEINIKDIAR